MVSARQSAHGRLCSSELHCEQCCTVATSGARTEKRLGGCAQDPLRSSWLVVIGTAKTLALGRTAGDVVVVLAPVADDDLASAQARELLDVEQFVADAPVERLDVGVLPRGAGVDV